MRKEMQLWSDFLEVWPPDRVRSMSLEQYTNPNRDDAFIYWLEKKTEGLGSIWGGSAFKFGIFRREEKDPKAPKGGRIWGDEYAWMRKYGETAEVAFAAVRSRLTDVIDAVRAGNLEAVDQVDFSPAVKWKVAFLYQDREDPKLLAIYSEKLLRARHGEVFPDAEERSPSQQHAALIEHYSWLGGVLDISPKIWLDPKEKTPPKPPANSPSDASADLRYWLMSLGPRSARWPTCRKTGTASIGYDDEPVGDLRQFDSREEIGRAMGSESGAKRMNDRLALWEFSHVMQPGDIIFVKRGQRDVVGHGIVRSQYRYDPARDQHRHLRDVDWKSDFPDGRRVRDKLLVTKTLTDVTEYAPQVADLKAAVDFDADTKHPRRFIAGRNPLNQILYGPPGTGKTYGTVNHAIAIIDGTKTDDVTDEDRLRFPSLKFKAAANRDGEPEGQIAMITFHQNYAYEDFVEGIRPKLTGDNEGAQASGSASTDLAYELRHGIFRRLCEAAGKEPDQPFVLIIDEINRGNIPKIFGELITLIEPSKRLGKNDEVRVTLPYSGHEFGVPDNLYIIGTMNTADRSIQQLDTALRRRFTFVEMMPDPDNDLISEDIDGVDCRKLLRAMNERIALLLDREHQIGHTYLLNVETMEALAERFRNQIFPLLQEYFYDDWRKIHAVLGENAFVQKRKAGEGYTKKLATEFDLIEEEHVVYERLRNSAPEWKAAGEYRRIYEEPKQD